MRGHSYRTLRAYTHTTVKERKNARALKKIKLKGEKTLVPESHIRAHTLAHDPNACAQEVTNESRGCLQIGTYTTTSRPQCSLPGTRAFLVYMHIHIRVMHLISARRSAALNWSFCADSRYARSYARVYTLYQHSPCVIPASTYVVVEDDGGDPNALAPPVIKAERGHKSPSAQRRDS